jgi:hypothetical protein
LDDVHKNIYGWPFYCKVRGLIAMFLIPEFWKKSTFFNHKICLVLYDEKSNNRGDQWNFVGTEMWSFFGNCRNWFFVMFYGLDV